jgi:hypothetical protein
MHGTRVKELSDQVNPRPNNPLLKFNMKAEARKTEWWWKNMFFFYKRVQKNEMNYSHMNN